MAVKRILFLCIGNSCRSPMAEGFARTYGSDVMEALSAGWAPATVIQPLTKKVMEEKNISLEEQFPKDIGKVDIRSLDMIVNMSGKSLPPSLPIEVREWKVEDPIGLNKEVYVAVRDKLEHLVMNLILELRRVSRPTKRGPSLRSRLGASSPTE